MKIYSHLIGSGAYLPSKMLTNDDLSKILDTSDEWISSRTGIKKRYIAAENEYTSDLAVKALQNALQKSGINKDSIDGIIVATTTPDQIFPATAAIIQAKLNLKGFAFDINAVCAGFVYALIIADGLIKSGSAKRVAIIGAETMSRILDWKDRSTCVLFGDGAGCFILEGCNEKKGILSSCFYSDGTHHDILKVPGGVSMGNHEAKVLMNGREVFKYAVEKMISCSMEALNKAKIGIEDINWVLPHQANQRILSMIGEKLNIDKEKMISTVAIHANTTAASIPLAFDHYHNLGKIKHNHNIVVTAFGAGLAWGALVLKI